MLDGTKSLYIQEGNIMNGPKDDKELPFNKETLQMDKVARIFIEVNVWKMDYFYLATDTKPSYIEW